MPPPTHPALPWVGASLVALLGACSGEGGESADRTSAAATAADAATIALANVGKGACSRNSAGGYDYGPSCTGNRGAPEYWCADFARWVWQQIGANTSGLTPAAGSFYTYGQHNGTLHGSPTVGDAVVFNYQGGGIAEHVAIVVAVNGNGTMETVSGDWSGKNGSEAEFASTSHVILNTPAYDDAVGSYSNRTGMRVSGFISPVGVNSAPPPAKPMRGSLDSVTCDSMSGWAQDPNAAPTPIPVDIYIDGPAGTGSPLGRFTAGTDRTDLCSAIGSCNHAFSVRPPVSLYDGHAHTVYAYAISITSGAPNALISGSPKTLHCATSLTGDFHGSGNTEVLQFRDDMQSLPICGRSGSEWSCSDKKATYIGGMGAGNAGSAIFADGKALVGDVNGDGKADVLQYNGAWQSIPVCLSTGDGWACENLKANYTAGAGAGNSGTGIYPDTVPLVADVNGDGMADLIQYSTKLSTIPVCFGTDRGWSCENSAATYVGGVGAGHDGTGIYEETAILAGDVNGDGMADFIQYNSGSQSIPVCFSTSHGWACDNMAASYVGGVGPGNSGSGVFGATDVKLADVNGDGKMDIIQFNPAWQSIPVCFSTGSGWSCENLKADYVGGMGAGALGSGIFSSTTGNPTMLVADVNGDGKADILQYRDDWESIPVCFSTGSGWSCENLKANYVGLPSLAGNAGTGIYSHGVPLVGRFTGGKTSSVVQTNPGSGWATLPFCDSGRSGWTCSSERALVY